MRKIERIKRRKTSVWLNVALWGTTVSCVALGGGVASSANENRVANESAAARAEGENGRFWPRLGSGATSISMSEFNGNANFADASGDSAVGWGAEKTPSAASATLNRVESANFVGYSVVPGSGEQANLVGGRPRLVDWTTPESGAGKDGARPLNSTQSSQTVANASRETVAGNGAVEETGKIGELDGIGEAGKSARGGENRGTAQNETAGEVASRSKTPILRDEPTASTKSKGSWGNAIVSTFGALAVVLGAFLTLVALLRRAGLKNGGSGGALEIVDSLSVGDKARLLTIRWGNRLILAAKTPENFTSLAEISDLDEANAILAEIEGRKKNASTGDVGANAAAIWKRGLDAANAWRATRGAKGRRQ